MFTKANPPTSRRKTACVVKWTQEEDRKLREAVEKHGARKWSVIARSVRERTGKQCRERWTAHLDPVLSVEPWSCEEDRLVLESHEELGNQWSAICRRLKGRSANAVKNRFNYLKRRSTRRPIEDPGTLFGVAGPFPMPIIVRMPGSGRQSGTSVDCADYFDQFFEQMAEKCDIFNSQLDFPFSHRD
jgi:hypothetical protein